MWKNTRSKNARKNLDLICANDVSQPDQGFNSDSNALHLFWQDGDKRLPLERKELLGQLLLDEIVTRYDEKIDVKILDPRWPAISAADLCHLRLRRT
jgi:phosphopantothenoylcysteine decarboxylase/phosphopantothenate--cysteine ligase